MLQARLQIISDPFHGTVNRTGINCDKQCQDDEDRHHDFAHFLDPFFDTQHDDN